MNGRTMTMGIGGKVCKGAMETEAKALETEARMIGIKARNGEMKQW